jgi:hypothetical protein
VIGEPEAPSRGASLGRGRSHGGQENSHAGRESSAGSGGGPAARSRRATAAVWFVVAVLSLAAAVLTVLAWGDLKTQDAVTNL